MRLLAHAVITATLLNGCAAVAQTTNTDRSWIEKSNQDTELLLDINNKYSPESAAQ